jgi:Dehydrogenase E1 component
LSVEVSIQTSNDLVTYPKELLVGPWKLQAIFLCENELYSEGTPQSNQASVSDLAVCAQGYGYPGVQDIVQAAQSFSARLAGKKG